MKNGGLYEGEYAERCGHANASDETTLQEKADYVEYSINKRIQIAKSVFGNGVFVGGEGSYEESSEQDIWGIYTSTSGRVYTEWRQSSSTSYGSLSLFSSGLTMANAGCGVHTCAMLLNSAGLQDVTPREAWAAYKSAGSCNYIGTMNRILRDNNVSGRAKETGSFNGMIEALKNGYGVMYHVYAGEYTSNVHWMVAADIRETQLGSSIGYDVYILSSTHRSGAGYGWQPIEKIKDNLRRTGYYIEN